MIKTTAFEKLSEITRIILKEDIHYQELKLALEQLKFLFLDVSGMNSNATVNDDPIFLNTGKAIGPKWAAMCIDDIMRTKRFVCGVYKAVQSIKKRKDNKPVQLLYVGTGPFATLVMPLITLFKPRELQFVFLEVNPLSIKSLKNTIDGFEANAYVKDIHVADASQFKLPETYCIDIFLAECLQHALVREPQVAITYNILSQLKQDVILIPEQITLYMGLLDDQKKMNVLMGNYRGEDSSYHKNSEAVFVLDKKRVFDKLNKVELHDLYFDPVNVLFTEDDINLYDELVITTEIKVFADEVLTINESGLTIPLKLMYLKDNKAVKGVIAQYEVNKTPGLKTTFIE